MDGHILPSSGRHAGAMPAREPLAASSSASFPLTAGLLLGLGVGGFFDGIVFHQILQWYHMLSSAGYRPDSLSNLQLNTLADGLFHASAYALVLWGLAMLAGGWRLLRRAQAAQPVRQADGAMLATGSAPPEPGQDVNLASESVAGEEDPGASLDMAVGANAPGSGSSSGSGGTGSGPASQPPAMNPGDEAPAGTPGTGEGLCRECGGSGRLAGGAACPACGGSGKVTVGVGGA